MSKATLASKLVKSILSIDDEPIFELKDGSKIQLKNDYACGDPECCGSRSYWFEEIKEGD